jgi:uncharacterized protein
MFFETTITLPLLRLRGLTVLLAKVETQAKEKNMTDADLLALCIAPDMFPLARQIQIVTDNAKGMASRMTRQEAPKYEDNESTLVELQARVNKTITYLETFTPENFADAATAEARFSYFPRMKMVGTDYVLSYALPNFFFHLVTVYAILRNAGFEIGKSDYMGGQAVMVADVV